MKCKKHPTDFSSGVGVCASCLRDRLFTLIAAQAEAQAQLHAQPPPPLVFPRSVSPYVSRRKSDNAAAWSRYHDNSLHRSHDQRFYSTPQVGPNGAVVVAGSLKKKHGGLAIFSHLFRSKSEKVDLDPRDSNSRAAFSSSSSSSPFWFPNMLNSRRKQQSRMSSVSESTAERTRRDFTKGHGRMFVSEYSDNEEFDRHCVGSSRNSLESSQGWKQTPRRTPADGRRGGKQTYGRNISGLRFCLSPLVRGSPNQHWNQKATPPDVVTVPGDTRLTSKSPVSNAASFCKNRSRKLVDLGRLTQNR